MSILKYQNKGYPIPETVNPEDAVCVVVPVPNDPTHLDNFYGALFTLTRWFNYREDVAKSGKAVADVWRDIFMNLEQQAGCMFIQNVRINGCVLEYTYNGVDWTPVGNFDNCYLELSPSSVDDNVVQATNDNIAAVFRAWSSSMSSNLVEWRNAANTTITRIDKNGELSVSTMYASAIRNIPGAAAVMQFGNGLATWRFNPGNTNKPVMAVLGETTIAKDIFQWLLSNGTLISAIDRLGRFRNALTSGVPVDTPTIKGAQAVDAAAEKFYIQVNTGWKEIGATGPQGIQGIQGIQGEPGADGADGTNGTDGIAYNDPDSEPAIGITKTYKMFCRADEVVVLPCPVHNGMMIKVTAASGWWTDEVFDPGDPFGRGYCWNGCEYIEGCDVPSPAGGGDPAGDANHMQLLVGWNIDVGVGFNYTKVELDEPIIVDNVLTGVETLLFFPNCPVLDGNHGGVRFTVEVTGYAPTYCRPQAGAGFVNFVSFNRYFASSGAIPNVTILGVPYYSVSICIDKDAPFEGECETCYEWSYDTVDGYTHPTADISWFSLVGCGGQSNISPQTDPFATAEGLCTYCMTIYSLTEFDFFFDLVECAP